jgi:threonine synthase
MLEVDGNFDASLDVARDLADRYPVTLVNSVNPFRSRGRRRPRSRSATRSAGARPPLRPGRQRREHLEPLDGLLGVPPDGVIPSRRSCSGSRRPGRRRIVNGAPVADPQTIATAIRIGNPASWDKAVAAATAVRGRDRLASPTGRSWPPIAVAREGLFVEPASAASVAGMLQLHAEGRLPAGRTVVCILTGHG